MKVYGAVTSEQFIVMGTHVSSCFCRDCVARLSDRMADSIRHATQNASKVLNRRVRLRIMQDVAAAFDSLYKVLPAGVVAVLHTSGRVAHRDLKADNVLFVPNWETVALTTASGSAPLARVIDFDCARSASGLPSTFTLDMGNPKYLPPEQEAKTPAQQLTMQGDYNLLKGDIYRFGIFAYEVWTGTFFSDHDGADRKTVLATKLSDPPVTLHNPKHDAAYKLFTNSCCPALTNLILSCWLANPLARPDTFAEIGTAWLPSRSPLAIIRWTLRNRTRFGSDHVHCDATMISSACAD